MGRAQVIPMDERGRELARVLKARRRGRRAWLTRTLAVIALAALALTIKSCIDPSRPGGLQGLVSPHAVGALFLSGPR